MRTFFIFTASAVLLAAIIVELSTRLWPGNDIALLIVAALALLAQGYLSLRFGTPASTAAKDRETGRKQTGGTNERGSDRGNGRRDRNDGNRKKASDGRSQADSGSQAAPAQRRFEPWVQRSGFVEIHARHCVAAALPSQRKSAQ